MKLVQVTVVQLSIERRQRNGLASRFAGYGLYV